MNRRPRQRGSIFIITLIVLVGLLIILSSVAATQRTNLRAEENRIEKQRARIAAQSGIERAKEVLQEMIDGSAGSGSSTTSTPVSTTATAAAPTTLNDDWAAFGQNGDERFVVGNGSFRAQIVDLASFVNLNTATEEQLRLLPLTDEQIDSLLDFREAGQDARAEGGKDQYYNNLSKPYNAKLKTFDTYDELLQVKGFTPNVLYQVQTDLVNTATAQPGSSDQQLPLSELTTMYSYSPILNPQGEAKINVGTTAGATDVSSAQKLQRIQALGLPPATATSIANGTWTSIGQLLAANPTLTQAQQQTILDNLTTSAAPRVQGQINLNTASEAVLSTVPGLTNDLVQAIIQRQPQGFQSLGEITSIPGITGQILQQTGDVFATSSQTFLVRVVGTSGDASFPMEAILDIQNNVIKIVQVFEPPYSDYLQRWGWQDASSTDTSLLEGK